MSKILMIVFLIFGTVVGSGFSSGKEIMVYFSRFGNLSYLYIFLAGILFFVLFYFFLNNGKKIFTILQNSKILNLVVLFISLVFCSSMFAGVKNLFSYFPVWAYFILLTFVLMCCVCITKKGIGGLEKLNFLLMPAISVLFLVCLIFGATVSSEFAVSTNALAGILFCPLYVALNTSMSGLVIAKVGEGLNKKQTFLICLFSTMLILVFLFLGNFVLLQNSESYFSEMPFLYLASKNTFMFVLCFTVILAGCFTTLISLCFTLKTAFEKVLKSDWISTLFAVFLPFMISVMGFSQIVSFLYPICSVLGVFVLGCLVVGCFISKTNQDFPRGEL